MGFNIMDIVFIAIIFYTLIVMIKSVFRGISIFLDLKRERKIKRLEIQGALILTVKENLCCCHYDIITHFKRDYDEIYWLSYKDVERRVMKLEKNLVIAKRARDGRYICINIPPSLKIK